MQLNRPPLMRQIERYAFALAPHAGPILLAVGRAAQAVADLNAAPALPEDDEAL